MDEFIENFNEFREWLYETQNNCITSEQRDIMDKVVNKFELLNLDEAF